MTTSDILRAKVDYHKTWIAPLLAGIIGSGAAFWANWGKNPQAEVGWVVAIILFVLVLVFELSNYELSHRRLIDELRKRP